MKPIKRVATQLASDSSIRTTVISISKYEKGAEYRNNERNIDLIAFDGSLYVYAGYGTKIFNVDDPTREADFLCVVRKGAQGEQGPKGNDGDTPEAPEFRARFDGGKVTIYSVQNGSQRRETVSPDLTGPSWKPKVEGNILSWERSWDKSNPTSINLEDLRPKEGRPILLRTNSDNTKRSDETSGPANFIQWKYEGQEEWTNLISISELMNLALAGVSIWYDEDDEKYHFGHKRINKASYDVGKKGGQIISAVELDDEEILYDAGPLPFATQTEMNKVTLDLATINAQICDILDKIQEVRLSIPDVSNCVREPIKTINGESLLGKGNILIPVVEKTSDIRNDSGFITDSALSNLATKEELSEKADKSESVNYQPVGEYLTEHQDISDKADKSEIPTNVSQLVNDVPYLVQSDLSEYAKLSDLDSLATKKELENISEKALTSEDIAIDIDARAVYANIDAPSVTVTNELKGNTKVFHFTFKFPANKSSEPTEETSTVTITTSPSSAKIFIDGQQVGIGAYSNVYTIGESITIKCTADGYNDSEETIILSDSEVSKNIVLTPSETPILDVYDLIVHVTPNDSKIIVNDIEKVRRSDGSVGAYEPGTQIKLIVSHDGYNDSEETFVMPSNIVEKTTVLKPVEEEELNFSIVNRDTQLIDAFGSNIESLNIELTGGKSGVTYTIEAESSNAFITPSVTETHSNEQWTVNLVASANTGSQRTSTITVRLLADGEYTGNVQSVIIKQSSGESKETLTPKIVPAVPVVNEDEIRGIPSGYFNGEYVEGDLGFTLGIDLEDTNETGVYGLAYKLNSDNWTISRTGSDLEPIEDVERGFSYGGSNVVMLYAQPNEYNQWEFIITPTPNSNSEAEVVKSLDVAITDSDFKILPNSWTTYRLVQDAKS